MNVVDSFAVIVLAGLVHACFQLSISVLTLMSGHAIGSGKAKNKLLGMTAGFVGGAGVMTVLLLSFVCLILTKLFGGDIPIILWTIGCGILVTSALSIWIFYYRRDKGTTLWVPRSIAKYITERAKATKLGGEAFGLGLSSVFGELLFIITPIFISSLVILQLPNSNWQLLAIGLYTLASMMPLIAVWMLINGGSSLGAIQKWRETNKHFLQFTSGIGLVVIALYLSVNEILVNLLGNI